MARISDQVVVSLAGGRAVWSLFLFPCRRAARDESESESEIEREGESKSNAIAMAAQPGRSCLFRIGHNKYPIPPSLFQVDFENPRIEDVS
jgi:hypothetical protein